MADRRNMGMKDMLVAIGVVVGALLLVVWSYSGFTFAPGGPAEGPAPTADAIGGFTKAGPALEFPAVTPQGLPAEWTANFFLLKTAENYGADVVELARAGWLTGDGFIALIESPASPADVLTQEIGPGSAAAGSITEGGRSWALYPGRAGEVAWVAEGDGATLVITGSAGEADFVTLARSLAG